MGSPTPAENPVPLSPQLGLGRRRLTQPQGRSAGLSQGSSPAAHPECLSGTQGGVSKGLRWV